MEKRAIEPASFAGPLREHTAPEVTQHIDCAAQAEADGAVAAGPEEIVRRLTQLDCEWALDRALMMDYAIAGAGSLTTGLMRGKAQAAASAQTKSVSVFLRCSPWGSAGARPLRYSAALGSRTQREIEAEAQ